jgi:PDZ domain
MNGKTSARNLLIVLLIGSVCVGQQLSKRMTNQDVIDMVALGLPDDVIIAKIRAVTATDFDTDVSGLRALKSGKVTDPVIRAMISEPPGTIEIPARQRSASGVRNEVASQPDTASLSSHTDVGVYLVWNGELIEVQPEIVNWQTGGVLKSTATLGIVKGDVNGKVMRGRSPTQTTNPIEFLVKTLEGTSVEEYQLLRLHQKSNRREFRSVTGGILHISGGADRDELPFRPESVGNRTWKIHLPDLPNGEYGFLPPGMESRSISASGKMFTFGIVPEILRQAAPRNVSDSGSMPGNIATSQSPTSHLDELGTIGASSDGNPTIRHDGITLSRVDGGGPADQAGINVGDVILAIDDHYLYTAQEMNDEILRHKPGSRINVRCRHFRTLYEASVVVGSAR